MRVAAHAVDLVIILLCQSLVLAVIYAIGFVVAPEGRLVLNSGALIDWRLVLIVGVAYHALMVARWGWTVGKRLCSVRVVEQDGHRPSLPNALLRALTQLASLATLGLVFLWVVWDRNRRALHDRLASTMVVRRGGLDA